MGGDDATGDFLRCAPVKTPSRVMIVRGTNRTRRYARRKEPSGWTVASFVLDAAATLWTQTSDGRQVLPILSTVSAGRIAALDVHRVDITADATLRAF
jgi:hypothetical protein